METKPTIFRHRKFFSKILRNDFIKNVANVGIGVVIAQIIGLLTYPLLSRIYTPEDFGLFGFFSSSVLIGAYFVSGAYEYSIPIALNKKEVGSIFKFCLGLASFLSIILLFTVILFEFFGYFELDIPFYLAVCIPLGIFVHSLTNIKNQVFIFFKFFKKMKTAKISQTSTLAITQIILGVSHFGIIGLVFGHILGRVSYLSINYKFDWTLLKESRFSFKKVGLRYFDHPKFVLSSTLIDVISKELPVFFILPFFGEHILGFYTFAFRILITPVLLVSTSINSVFFQQISNYYNNKKKISPILLKTWGALFIFGILPFGLLFIWGEQFFSFTFGSEWRESGKVASLLSLMAFARFVYFPTSKILLVLRKKKWLPIFSALSLTLTGIALFLGKREYDFYLFLKLYTISQIIVYTSQIFFSFLFSKQYEKNIVI